MCGIKPEKLRWWIANHERFLIDFSIEFNKNFLFLESNGSTHLFEDIECIDSL